MCTIESRPGASRDELISGWEITAEERSDSVPFLCRGTLGLGNTEHQDKGTQLGAEDLFNPPRHDLTE